MHVNLAKPGKKYLPPKMYSAWQVECSKRLQQVKTYNHIVAI